MEPRSSPMTSESKSVTILARVDAASPPPLTNDKCFLTTLISLIVAPLRSSRRVVRCLSASVTPATGAGSRLDAPPDKRTISRSRGVRRCVRSRSRRVAWRPARSGIGWAASTTAIRLVASVWPVLTMTSPSSNLVPSAVSTACAILADALPAPTAIIRSICERS